VNNTEFHSIGTDILVIGSRRKVGTSSLRRMLRENNKVIKKYITFDKNKITIVLLRDVIDKWKSGYQTEIYCCHVCHNFPRNCVCENKTKQIRRPFHVDPTLGVLHHIDDIAKIHDVSSDLSWMYYHHAQFWSWNDDDNVTLEEMIKYDNIWFLDLKDLSNLKFLEWIYEKDEKWKIVKEITHDNKGNPKFWDSIDSFWKDYKEGKVFKNRTLACPFYDLPENKLVPGFEDLYKRVKEQQDLVDFIRKNHERYLRFE